MSNFVLASILMETKMRQIDIKEVGNKHEMDEFVEFGNRLYTDCPYYVPDLKIDIHNFFSPKSNPGLEFSDVQPFIACDENGKVVGRVAAIINHKANKTWNVKNVRFGFLDFVDDIDVAAALLRKVETWGRERGMTNVQGPMGITDFDKEGMLVEDFDKKATIITLYNYPYYPKYLEQLGYKKEVDWISICIDIPDKLPEKFVRVEKLVTERFGLRMKRVTKCEIMKGGYGHKIFNLLNSVYSPLFGFSELSTAQIDYFLRSYIPFIDTRCISLVENKNEELVAAAITMPSLSEAMRKTKGKLLPLGWYHLLKAIKMSRSDKLDMMLIAIRSDYQGMGVNALLFKDIYNVCHLCGYTHAETGPQLENNSKELSQWKLFDPEYVKRRRCFTKQL